MPRQEFTGYQIKDGTIFREDLNITTSGRSVIRKIIPGSGINISYDGVDSGTGDVTINSIINPDSIIDDSSDSTSFVWSSFKTNSELDNLIDDNIISSSKMWSSSKINNELNNIGLNIIDDSSDSTSFVWSSFKTKSEIDSITSNLNSHINDLSIHREINDSTSSIDTLWSSSKIQSELNNISFNNLVIDSSPTNLSGNGIKTTLTVQENNTGFGSCLGVDSTTSYLVEACADSTSVLVPCRFIALDSGTGNKTVIMKGFIRNDSWSFTPGSTLYLSIIKGQISESYSYNSGDIIQVIGYSLTSNTIFFDPDYTFLTVS